MKNLNFLIFFLVSIYYSPNSFCQNNKLGIYKIYFKNGLYAWTKSFQKFNLQSFQKEKFTEFENIKYAEVNKRSIKDFYAVYKQALDFSPGKDKFIDIYSYWLALDKEGKQIVSRGGEPDQAITLCDFKTKKWLRIFFRGTTERIQEVQWISNSKFILTGIEEDAIGKPQPIIYIGDTKRKKFIRFVSEKNSFQKITGYVSPKLLKLKIKEI